MKYETSAGGVVYRALRNSKQDVSQYSRALRPLRGLRNVEFLVVQHSGHHRWVLPKGLIDLGETKEAAAVREVKEEAGVEAEAEDYLGEFTIFYTSPDKEKVRKTSHFFLMRYKAGDPSKELGWEMKDFVWLLEKEAIEKLDYPGEKKMIEKASEKLSFP
jgi:8-oxo-dGTP pyrophosphatase MutT (NUDIX family)